MGLVLLAAPPAVAQDIDDFFSEPDEVTDGGAADPAETTDATGDSDDAAEEETESPSDDPADGDGGNTEPAGAAVDIDALTTSPTRVSGSVSADAGISLGFNEWPGTPAAENRSFAELRQESAGYAMSASVTVDSRPRPYLRFYTKLTSSLSATSLGFSSPAVNELFVDYTLNDTVFFRAGKFGISWGRARIFESPGNLVSRVNSGAAFRASVPLRTGSVTAVAYTIPGWVSTHGQGDPRSFAGALQFERSLGVFSTELAAHYQDDEGAQGSAVLTAGIGAATLAGEARYQLDRDRPGAPGTEGNAVTAIGNFFWENPGRSWTFWGEYSYNAARRESESGDDGVRRDGEHLVGLAMKAPPLAGGEWRPQLSWRHAVGDGSGQVIAGTEGTVARDLTLSVGVPVFYGRPGTYYRSIAETRIVPADSELSEQEEQVLLISGRNVISFTVAVSVSFSF